MAKKSTNPSAKAAAPKSSPSSANNDHMIAGIFSYLGILVIIPILAVQNKDEFVRFHIRQGIVLAVVELILWVASWFIGFLLWVIWPILNLVWLALLVLSIWCIVQALQGKQWKIPVLGEFADKVKI